MNKSKFREQLTNFLKDDGSYKKFVAAINRSRNKRLFYWQESCLEKFCTEHQIEVPSFSELSDILRVCEIHEVELIKGTQEFFGGEIDYSQRFTMAANLLFPYSNSMLITGSKEQHGQKRESWYCEACIEAEKKWRNSDI